MAAGGSQIHCWRFGSAEAQSWVFVQREQVPWQELVPFGILAVVQGSTTLPPIVFQPSALLSEQSC